MTEWKDEARRLFAEGMKPKPAHEAMQADFPDATYNRIRHLYDDEKWGIRQKTELHDNLPEPVTPEKLMQANGIDPEKWQLVSFRPMSSSKITVKPKENKISFDEVKKWFTDFETTYKPPQVNIVKPEGHLMLEVNIADLHFAKLAWHGETGEDYDYKIATERYQDAISDIIASVPTKRIERIIYPFGNDWFNSDNEEGSTTKGTMQNNDLRWKKMFVLGCELAIAGVDRLGQIANTELFNVGGNHDEVTSFYGTYAMQKHFASYPSVNVSIDGEQRKYIEYYNVLIGFSHGDEDKPRIRKLMQIEAREAWGRTPFHEMHTGHLHSEQVVEDGGLIWRVTSSLTGPDSWHSKSGFVGAVRKTQSFLYDREKGLVQIINTVV